MQPVAVYVPASYVPGKDAPLIVFFHGNPQSESQLLAPRFVRELAEANGTILVAPYGRGYYDFAEPRRTCTTRSMPRRKRFTVDPRKRFLVGYSMGGFSVFEVAPDRPNTWTAVMCISGALLGSDAPRLLAYMPEHAVLRAYRGSKTRAFRRSTRRSPPPISANRAFRFPFTRCRAASIG